MTYGDWMARGALTSEEPEMLATLGNEALKWMRAAAASQWYEGYTLARRNFFESSDNNSTFFDSSDD